MDRWNTLIWRLRTSAIWNELPPELRQPPGLWLLLAVFAALVLVALYLLVRGIRGLAGGGALRGAEVARGRAAIRRDLKQALAQGDLRTAAELQQLLGKDGRALELFSRGGHHEEEVALLLRLGRRDRARAAARQHGVWHVVAELDEEEGKADEAALAWERAGKPFLAARAWEQAGNRLQSARCFTAAGLEAEAVRVAAGTQGRQAAEVLEEAVRSSLTQATGASMSLDMSKAVRDVVQLWLAEGEAERAWHLAVDSEQLDLAAPIARDFLPASAQAADLCERGGSWLVAADLWKRLGNSEREAKARAEHHERRGNAADAAHWLERSGEVARAADQWAAADEPERAADLYAQVGEFRTAADLYARAGKRQKLDEMLLRLDSTARASSFDEEPTVRSFAGSPVAGSPVAGSPVAGTQDELASSEESRLVTEGHPVEPSKQGEGYSTVLHEAPPGVALPPDLLPDARYRLLEELGRGGMGRVYRAEDAMLQRQVAYKVLPENVLADPSGAGSLLAEARAAARLSHPNIVQVYDVGRRGQGVFVVMELVQGPTFEELLSQQEFSIPWLRRIGVQIANALAHAHGRQIVHRDLKPSNLLWSGEEERVKLTDFGLARVSDEAGKVATRPAGTPSYMSPEQIRGDDLDYRADIYAFGCVLFELATGRPVFSGGIRSLHKHLSAHPTDPRTLRVDLDDEVAELILACLHKDPASRPESAAELARRLSSVPS